jgi:hypothetical protein
MNESSWWTCSKLQASYTAFSQAAAERQPRMQAAIVDWPVDRIKKTPNEFRPGAFSSHTPWSQSWTR